MCWNVGITSYKERAIMFTLYLSVWLYGYTTIVIQHPQAVLNKVLKVQVAQLAN